MKLTLRCVRNGDVLSVTWNQNAVDISKIASSIATVRGEATVVAECSFGDDKRIVATQFLQRVDPHTDEPGFDDFARAKKLVEQGLSEEARRVLVEAPVLPPEGLLLRAQLVRDPASCALVLEELVTHPRATDAHLAEIAASAIACGVAHDAIVELLGERLASARLVEIAWRLLADQPSARSPTWWVQQQFTDMIEELDHPCGYACEGLSPDDDAAWDEILASRCALLDEARRRGISGATDSIANRIPKYLAEERRREKSRAAAKLRHRSGAFEALARHHRSEVPCVLREAWLEGNRRLSFLPLEQYFEDPAYGARARLESLDLFEPRYLVFGAELGSEGPPFYALDLEDGFRVVELDPEMDEEPRHLADSLQSWECWRPLR